MTVILNECDGGNQPPPCSFRNWKLLNIPRGPIDRQRDFVMVRRRRTLF